MMRVFICKICGEVYIGNESPKSCPFCGVAQKFLWPANAWKDANDVELTDVSKKNLEEALILELSNTAFYFAVAEKFGNSEIGQMFKGLAKVEREHASVFRKILRLETLPEVKEESGSTEKECLADSLEREERAVAFYGKALGEAEEPRVREVFEAIMNTEKDHIELDEVMGKKY